MNKKISIILGLVIITVSAVVLIGGAFAYQYWWVPKEGPGIETTKDETAGWKVFRDNEVGYSFKYPSELKAQQVVTNGLKEKITRIILQTAFAAGLPPNTWGFKSDYLVFDIQRQKIEDIPDNFILQHGYSSKEQVLQDMESLSKGEFGISPMPGWLKESEKVVKIDNEIYGKEFATLSIFEICDVLPTRTLIFFRNGYKVSIVLQAWAVGKIQSELPQYFTTNKENCGNDLIWGAQSQFYSDLVSGKISSETEAGIWYNTFDKIVSTIDLFVPSNCFDSDAAIPNSEYVKGYVELNGIKHWDECYGVLNHLQEYYCGADGSWKISDIECSDGCQNGACVELDETAGWQTYTNPDFGYEIKYPSNFSIDKDSWSKMFVLDVQGQQGISVQIDDSGLPLEQEVHNYVNDSKEASKTSAAPLTVFSKPYKIGNLSGYLVTTQAGDVMRNTGVIFVVQGKYNIFKFSYSYQGYILDKNPQDILAGAPITQEFQNELQSKIQTYNQVQKIISTFRFLK